MHTDTPNAALAEDLRARVRALDPDSFIVQAPAGSGKTELLTQRFLALLARVDRPEEVVALTFTTKAAGEMRARILSSLAMAQAGPRPDLSHRQVTYDLARAVLARDAALRWDLAGHPGRLNVMTIDALCGSLVRRMPFASGFGGQPQVASDPARHYARAAQDTLALLEDDGEHADCVRTALRYFRNDARALGALLADMLARRDQWQCRDAAAQDAGDARTRARHGLDWLVAGELRAAAAGFGAAAQQGVMAAARYAAARNPDAAALADWSAALSGQAAELPAWRALAALLLTSAGKPRRTLRAPDGFPAGDAAAAVHRAALLQAAEALSEPAAACLDRVRELPAADAVDAGWDMVDAVERLLALAEAALWKVFRAAGVVDFIAIAGHAAAAAAAGDPGDPADPASAPDERIRHLLIDEFQDTSPGQVALAAALTRGWAPGDGRTLFLVGDPMQSIYRFRKAEVGLFLDVARAGIGGLQLEHLRLYRNNRSDPVIVDWVNAVFPSIFPQVADARSGAVDYAPCSTDRAPCGHAAVVAHPFLAGRTAERDAEEEAADADGVGGDEARRILQVVDATHGAHPDARIAVLVRARSHLDDLVATVRRLRPGLAYQAVEMEPLSARQPIQDLLALTHALCQRADRVHWLAVLRAPWCGLTLADLHRLAGDDHDSTIWQLMHDEARLAGLSEDGRLRLLHVRAVCAEAFAHQGRQRPARWVEQVWRLLGGPACLDTAADLQDAEACLALLDDCTRAGLVDRALLAERVAKLYASPNPDPAAARLQLMTIHKSKGLEFDCVIVPGLGQAPRKGERRLLAWEAVDVPGQGTCIVPAVPPRSGGGGADERLHGLLRGIEVVRERHEAQRLLYVAATRARRSLHLLGTLKDEDAPRPAAGSLLELLWSSPARDAFLQALDAGQGGAEAAATVDAGAFVAPLVRLDSAAIAQLSARQAARSAAAPDGTGAAADDGGPSLDAATGTLVHRYLEMIANDGLAQWPAARCATLQAPCLAWLRGQGFYGADAAAASARALQALSTVLASETGRWILGPHDEAHAERALSSRGADGGAPARHIVDRTFVSGGQRWIVDYKTVRCNADDARSWLRDHAAANYRDQLRRYAGLFAGEGLALRTAIFYVLQGELVEVALEDGA
jgi:ATP-dependent helicase/nuclease subunit A